MILKLQSKENGNWFYQIKRQFVCHKLKEPFSCFSNRDYDLSLFDEDYIKKWKESDVEAEFIHISFLDEDLNEITIGTFHCDIYLLNDSGKTIEIINRR